MATPEEREQETVRAPTTSSTRPASRSRNNAGASPRTWTKSSSPKTTANNSARVSGLRPYDEQRRYLFEQLSRALGDDWIARNERLIEEYWQAVVTLGYALPDERPADDQEAAA